MMIGRVVGVFSFVFSVCMYVCLGVRRGLSRVLIKYSGNVRLQFSCSLLHFTLSNIEMHNISSQTISMI